MFAQGGNTNDPEKMVDRSIPKKKRKEAQGAASQ
jgi:hypothetical protein